LARKYEKYKPEFRDEVARLVVETTRSIADVSREYGLNETTVGGWVWRASNLPDCGPNRVRFGKEYENTRNTSPSSVTR
jgi:transposase-like protein